MTNVQVARDPVRRRFADLDLVVVSYFLFLEVLALALAGDLAPSVFGQSQAM